MTGPAPVGRRAAATPRPNIGVTCSGNFFGFDVLGAVEELGFDAFYTGEHFVYDKPVQDCLPVLGAAAAATSRIAIGSAAFLVPLYPPALLAKSASTIDVLSGGRLVCGIGVGGDYPAEFDAFGIPTKGRGRRTDEALDVLRAFWTGGPVVHHGELFHIDGASISPPPVQLGGPPIWVAGRSEATARRAALRGDGFFPYLVSADSYGGWVDRIRTIAAEEGRRLPNDFAWAVRLELRLDDTDDEAVDRVAQYLSWRFSKPFTWSRAERWSLAGTPERVVEKMLAYIAAGVDVFALQPVGRDPGEMCRVLERFAAEVMPQVRASRLEVVPK
jgi:probable F420-dependent oxidoreductase